MLPPFVRKKTWIIVGKLQYVHSQGVARLFPFPKPLVCIIGKINLASGFRAYGYFWVEMFHNYSPKRRSLPHLLPQLPTSRSPRWGFLVESPSCFSGVSLKESREPQKIQKISTEEKQSINLSLRVGSTSPGGTFSMDKTKPRMVCPSGDWSLTHRDNLALEKSKNQVYKETAPLPMSMSQNNGLPTRS